MYHKSKYLRLKLKKDLKKKLSCRQVIHSINIDEHLYHSYLCQISICYSPGIGFDYQNVILDIAKLNQPHYVVWRVNGKISFQMIYDINKCLLNLNEFKMRDYNTRLQKEIIQD